MELGYTKREIALCCSHLNFQYTEPSFFNYSSNPNLESIRDLLLPGLKHAITPKDTSDQQIMGAFQQFINKTHWQVYFKDQTNTDYNPILFKDLKRIKGDTPICGPLTKSRHPIIKTTNLILKDVRQFLRQNPVNYKAGSEHRIYKKIFQDYPGIIFVAADKNLGLVAFDVETYFNMTISHLLNQNVYIPIHKEAQELKPETWNKKIIHITQMIITHETNSFEYEYLKKFEAKNIKFEVPKFHSLAKLHKWKNKQQLCPSRPIAGARNWYTTHISTFVGEKLKPYILTSTTILKNTTELIIAIRTFNENPLPFTHFITFDVESLYTNIDITILVEQALRYYPQDIIDMIKFVLDNSYVTFNDQVYKQINGLAMGTNMAVAIANIYMSNLVDNKITQARGVKMYKRYIDDLYVLFDGTEEEAFTLKTYMNNLVPGLQFTMEISTDNAIFLDLDTFRIQEKIQYKLYQKELNKYGYITPYSCHTISTFKGWIYGELLRINKNNSTAYYYEKHKQLFLIRLLKRGYSFKMLIPIFRRQFVSFENLPKKKESLPLLPIIIPKSRRKGMDDLPQLVRKYTDDINMYLPNKIPTIVSSKVVSIGSALMRSSLTQANQEAYSKQIDALFGQDL
jgi:hypothetical protein